MDFDELYWFRPSGRRGQLWATPAREALDAVSGHDFADLTLGTFVPPYPLAFVRDSGRRVVDYVGTTMAVVSLMSGRLADVLDQHRFTGWRTFPVTVTDDDGESLGAFHGMVVTGRTGRIDIARSKRVAVGDGRRAISKGFYFDPLTWDGSDLFVPEGTTFVFVVAAVKRAVERAGLTGCSFERLTEIESPIYQ